MISGMGLRSSDEDGFTLGHAEAGHEATVRRCRELGEQIRAVLVVLGRERCRFVWRAGLLRPPGVAVVPNGSRCGLETGHAGECAWGPPDSGHSVQRGLDLVKLLAIAVELEGMR